MISDNISDNIPPQMNILNIVNPILQFALKLERCKPHTVACHPTKCDVINDVKLFPTDILSQIFYVIQSDIVLQTQVH